MFTSRAEYRILLRQDNADQRLTPLSHAIGLASRERMEKLEGKIKTMKLFKTQLEKTSVSPEQAQGLLASILSAPLQQKQKAISVLNRPGVSAQLMFDHIPEISAIGTQLDMDVETLEAIEVQIKYAGYIEKEQAIADKLQRLHHVAIPVDFNYHALESLSSEAREKLTETKPETLAGASRISGVSASDLAVLLVNLGR